MKNSEWYKNMSNKILIWAHRGASGYLPENTLPAFRKAAELGADGVELDIQMTKDGEIVVCHDETINRTSNGKGWIKDYNLAALKLFDFSKVQKGAEPCEIPTLREVFELLKPTGLTINIELKTGVVFYEGIEEKTIALVKEYGMEDRVIYSSFNHASVVKIKQIDPAAKTAFLYADGLLDPCEYALKHRMNALHPALYNLQYPGFVQSAEEAGIDVNVWTVNTEEHAKMCAMAGVNAIITNYPDLVRKAVEGK